MKISLNQHLEKLSAASDQHLLISCGSGKGLAMSGGAKIEFECEGEISFICDFKKAKSIAKSLADPIDVKLDSCITFSSKGRKFKLNRLDTVLPDWNRCDRKLFDLDCSLFSKASYCAGNKDVRYYLNGVCMRSDGDSVRLASSDGSRISEVVIDVKIDSFEYIIPRSAFGIIEKLGDCEVLGGTNLIMFKKDNFCYSTRVIEGKYTDYRKAFTHYEIERKLKINKDIIEHVKCAAIVQSSKYNDVIFEDNKVKSISETGDTFEVEYKNDINMGFNSSQFIDFLNSIDEDEPEFSVFRLGLIYQSENHNAIISKVVR